MTAQSLMRKARTIITGFIMSKTERTFIRHTLFMAMLHYKMAPNTNLNEIIGLVKPCSCLALRLK